MPKSKNKNRFQSYIKKLNEFDINQFLASMQDINLDDLKNIDLNQLLPKIRKSPILKSFIGLAGASFLFAFLLLPSIQNLISTIKKARLYQIESNNLDLTKDQLQRNQKKIKEIGLPMSEFNQSILKKDKIIFLTKLINETSEKANVEIISFAPIDQAKSAKLCKGNNQQAILNKRSRSSKSRGKNKIDNSKGAFQNMFYELNLKSDYLNVMEFLKIIQYYDVTIIPQCIQVAGFQPRQSKSSNNEDKDKKSTIITPLSQSGLPLDDSGLYSQLNSSDTYVLVKSRLVLKIPAQSR
tara:strand:+ start:1936 stop:2823 length:888 start_codon:yes stop_codon:yes gene_type:complete